MKYFVILIASFVFSLSIECLLFFEENNKKIDKSEKHIVELIKKEYPPIVRGNVSTKGEFKRLMNTLNLHLETNGVLSN